MLNLTPSVKIIDNRPKRTDDTSFKFSRWALDKSMVIFNDSIYVGKIGGEVSLKEGYESAKICAINCLAAIKSVIGSLDKIDEIIKVKGYVNSTSDFYRQPEVVNGASELIVKIFGEKGKHARSALGTSVLPGNIPVELEMIVKVK